MYKCKLEAIKVAHNRIKTIPITGFCVALPELNKQFVMYHGDSSILNTNIIIGLVRRLNEFHLQTASGSHYRVTLLEENE